MMRIAYWDHVEKIISPMNESGENWTGMKKFWQFIKSMRKDYMGVASKNRRKEPGHSGYFQKNVIHINIYFRNYHQYIFISCAYCCLSNDPIAFKNRSVQSSLLTNYSYKTTLFRVFS